MPYSLVTIATFGGATEAHIYRLRLEAEGIFCMIADEHIITANPFMAPALGGIKLKVRAQEAEAAHAILTGLRQGHEGLGNLHVSARGELYYKHDQNCPGCDAPLSPEPGAFTFRQRLTVLWQALGDIVFPQRMRPNSCRACGHRWR